MVHSNTLEQQQLFNLATQLPLTMASAMNTTNDALSRPHFKAVTPPSLPTELWLQVFEQLDDVEFLWCTVRSVSKEYRAFVNRVFVTSFLPTISISLSLPRLDPRTGRARYTHAIPGSEITLQCQNPDVESPRLTLKTPHSTQLEQLTASEALSKQRLDEAEAWMWFGRQRGKGARVVVDKDIRWNEEEKVWVWSVEWESLVNRYFVAKRASRRTQRRAGKDVSFVHRLRR